MYDLTDEWIAWLECNGRALHLYLNRQDTDEGWSEVHHYNINGFDAHTTAAGLKDIMEEYIQFGLGAPYPDPESLTPPPSTKNKSKRKSDAVGENRSSTDRPVKRQATTGGTNSAKSLIDLTPDAEDDNVEKKAKINKRAKRAG